MSPHSDLKPLKAFFQEVREQLDIELEYHPDNLKFPIQLTHSADGISKAKCLELSNFIKVQVDLRDNQIAQIHPGAKPGKFMIEISAEATKALVDVYALSLFYDPDEEDSDS